MVTHLNQVADFIHAAVGTSATAQGLAASKAIAANHVLVMKAVEEQI